MVELRDLARGCLWTCVWLASLGCAGGDDTGSARAASADAGTECAPWETPLDGACRPPGVPATACGPGFVPDDLGGCNPVLPQIACEAGWMAVPGESACHEVAPCAEGPWGDIPVADGDSELVDGAYGGADSDGSAAKPWTTIQDAIDAAAPGAIVAVAAGSYAEDVLVSSKPIRLWGRCPALVEIDGPGVIPFALALANTGADGSEVHDIAITGNKRGIGLTNVAGVVLDRVWIHDTANVGLWIDRELGPASVVLRRSLIEQARTRGAFVAGGQLEVDAVVVRDILPDAVDGWGVGIWVQDDLDTAARSTVVVRGSLVERATWGGITVAGSDATVEATVIRDTLPNAQDQTGGRGINLENDPDTANRGSLLLVSSIVERNHELGVFVGASDATIDATVVRDTRPRAANGAAGKGVSAEDEPGTGMRASLTMRDSLVERNHDVGIYVAGSDGTVERTAVRDTLPRESDQRLGIGLAAQRSVGPGALTATMCAIERSHQVGILVLGGTGTIADTLVRETRVTVGDGFFGDGIAIVLYDTPTFGRVDDCRVEASARAGISVFGATAELSSTELECNAIHLLGETIDGVAPGLQDQGGNTCACGGASTTCQVVSSGVLPPTPVSP